MLPERRKALIKRVERVLSDPIFLEQIRESLGEPLLSSNKIGENAERTLRSLISKTFDLNPELVGVHDEDHRVKIEIGPVSASFMKITRIVLDSPEMEEEKMCIGCGDSFTIAIEGREVFCNKCSNEGTEKC
jgi:hypothetical protein